MAQPSRLKTESVRSPYHNVHEQHHKITVEPMDTQKTSMKNDWRINV